MAPNQKELAKLAGVSAGTVSNVISGSAKVSERSRQKVLDAIRVLNYRPNLIARSLKTNRTYTLGIVIPDITIPFFPKIVRGAEAAARERGYFLIVLDSEGSAEREADMLALLRAQRVEGILLVTAQSREAAEAEDPQSVAGSPIVCVDRVPVDLEVDSVCVDDAGASEMATAHLIENGHTRIAIITGPLSLQNERERLRGYRNALTRAGIPVDDSLIWNAAFGQEVVSGLCQRGFRTGDSKPTALLATNGVTGMAALRSLYSLGLRTPRDFAFVTFDQVNAEALFKPGISTVVQPTYEMGHRAVEVLLRRIEGGEQSPPPITRVQLPAELVVRESSSSRLKDEPAKSETKKHAKE